MTKETFIAEALKEATRDIKRIRPYIPTQNSAFDELRSMKKVELTDWFNSNRHFYDKIVDGDKRPFVLKMVSKLQYANLLLKRIIISAQRTQMIGAAGTCLKTCLAAVPLIWSNK